ncbi:fructosamine kinase family protein [Exilibacterium tricleocarpae]|uniref:Fructosamine kinase family protein n=1 Tax=Exilibacterium tricleocarpae TaxID=2591008 RepID=A0A545T8H4_9GAMM|nr:fructosamine kinase family protein [Exilibacterium tricleocarpae]TQV73517.1 fructosamine kinase family protein [Exilibacterium tricleocarpae]
MQLAAAHLWLRDNDLGTVVQATRLGGGDICATWYIETDLQQRFCLKVLETAPADMFHSEAASLEAIHNTGTLPAPVVFEAQAQFLAMEYIAAGTPAGDYWQQLGRGLGLMHRQPAPHFGFGSDNYCGTTPQPNPRCDCGFDFFAEQRLLYQARLAQRRGLLSSGDCQGIEQLAARLPELVPEQPPSLVHGDLWSGNIHINSAGAPVLIDPAAHWGWAETDIAMTRLFGGFAEDFYRAYLAVNPLAPGWEQRLPLYNLYHLLNHLNLFGRSYYGQVRSVLAAFQ